MNNMRRRLKKLSRLAKDMPDDAYRFFVNITPIRSGNARRKTRLSKDTIKPDYPYALRLDRGWSNQARNGMSKPTVAYIRKQIKGLK